jgi:antitoxin VapB
MQAVPAEPVFGRAFGLAQESFSAHFELPGDEAIMHRDGDKLVIEPVRKRGLLALLESMKPLKEEFPESDDPAPERERVL